MSQTSQTIRSFALVGHGGSGKTHLADALARVAGRNTRLGSPADGSSLFDFEEEEQKRGGSISTHVLTADHDGFRFHILDTPGDGNFVHDAQTCLKGVDAAVLVISAVDGIEVNTERMAASAAKLGLPRAVFINKMDRERADHQAIMGELKDLLGVEPVAMQLPIGREASFRGVVDLVNQKALIYSGDGGTPKIEDVPSDMRDEVALALEAMTEAVATTDDELVEKYLDEGELTSDEVRAGLKKGIAAGTIVPVIYGSASHNVGADQLLAYARAFPAPSDRAPITGHAVGKLDDEVEVRGDPSGHAVALVLKTIIDPFAGQISLMRVFRGTLESSGSALNSRTGDTERLGQLFYVVGKKQFPTDTAIAGELVGVAKLRDTHTGDSLTDAKDAVAIEGIEPPPPMISYTVKPCSRGDEDKVKVSLSRILAEDAGLRQGYDEVTKEIVVSGMGANHVRLAVERMARKYGVKVDLGTPTIPYRETIAGNADVRYRHKKQTGGAGQFGEVAIRVTPNPGGDFEFISKVVGGVIPSQLIPSVEKGVRKKLAEGVLAGFPVVGVTVELYDGKTHPVDSKDIAFQIAGRQAMHQAIMQSRPVLLEPIYEMEIVVPEDSVGDIMGDMNSRRGRILTMETRGKNSVVKALVPLAEILTYSPDLNSMTGGKGAYTMALHAYEPVPAHMQDKLVEEIKRHVHDDEH